MQQVITDNIYAGFYLLMWIVTFIWYQRVRKTWDGGSAIIFFYVVYGVFSILSLNDAIFSIAYNPLKLCPYIYLYVMMMIALSPAIYNHLYPSDTIEEPNTKVVRLLAILMIVCAVLTVPNLLSNFGTGFLQMFTDTEAGQDAYNEQLGEAGEAGSGISNLPAIIYNSISDLAIFLFFYFLTHKKKSKFIVAGLGFAICISAMTPIMQGQRGGAIIGLQTIILGYMMFRRYLSIKINHIVQVIGVSFALLITIPVLAITLSRFGEQKAGLGGFFSWYIGQGSLYFNNHALDNGGIRNGDRTANLLKRLVDSDTPKNFVERRDKYHNLELDDNLFSTFVGDFTIDYGPYAAVVIFIVFNAFVLTNLKPRDGTLKLHQMLLLYFALCISMQGGMTLFSYSDTANLRIVTTALLYVYLRYHDVLLEKFPIETKHEKDT